MTQLARQALDKIKSEKVKWVALEFLDVPGFLQRITIPAATLEEHHFKGGIGKLDGSSIKGFKEIHESDMLMMPDPTTFSVLPWYPDQHKTARFVCDLYEGFTAERFTRDPRFIAQKAEQKAKDMGFDATYWGPEAEFFVFDAVKITPNPTAAINPIGGVGYEVSSRESQFGSPTGKHFPVRLKEGYYPAAPVDTLVDFRNEACRIMQDNYGITIDAHHHEVAHAGQCEINMLFDTLVKTADNIVSYKNVVKMLAAKMDMIATFMPKPLYGENASGMHVNQSLWKDGKNAFYDSADTYAELSQTARYYIGGLLEHARALCAFTNPTTNSYRRLVPGFEAPVFIAYSKRNRSANVRIPVYHAANEKAKRVEYRTPDPSANIYLALSALLAAGLDGIKRKIEPGSPIDEDIYKLTAARRRELGVKELPGSLKEACESLQSDNEFLQGIFTKDMVETHIDLKRDEQLQLNLRPTAYEFHRYLDI